MTPTISTTGLTRRYGDHLALGDVSVDIEEGKITGLLGRNGAGKSTFLRIVTAQEFASAGSVRVFGESPVENERVLKRLVLVREDQQFPDFKVRHALSAASWFYPNWDSELADTLLRDFDLPTKRPVKKLSRGMRSALSITIGLAARAELTLLDEPYAGLDAVARQLFYDRLLDDYSAHPRTILLSTHLIDEVADLLEHVVMIDKGRVVLDAAADELRGSAVTVTGPALAVDDFVSGRRVLHRRKIGSRASVTVADALDPAATAKAKALHLKLEPLSLQQLMVHTSNGQTAEEASA
ncbi:ABC transporter ATP-binding protein [Amycolatopsis roodepoortensis]|uniref:ABC-2 type transport system ATP-binding protein n=1 Tax=Amycolatopsis roodepoortensis TaxID=700274 RepID=A0ABR9L4W0_9PSEU|nr:ABC transporter ATP-binding protein [Amycolatopsis roodepoortensis]MBE1575186.1 ABC-2 type transport system ATP-binding protein [Amycolatopsis roodepoortensis]